MLASRANGTHALNVKWYSHYEKIGSSLKVKTFGQIWCSSSIPRYVRDKASIQRFNKCYINFTFSSLKLGKICIYTHTYIWIYICIYITGIWMYNGILLGNIKEWTVDVHNYMKGSANNYAEKKIRA